MTKSWPNQKKFKFICLSPNIHDIHNVNRLWMVFISKKLSLNSEKVQNHLLVESSHNIDLRKLPYS